MENRVERGREGTSLRKKSGKSVSRNEAACGVIN